MDELERTRQTVFAGADYDLSGNGEQEWSTIYEVDTGTGETKEEGLSGADYNLSDVKPDFVRAYAELFTGEAKEICFAPIVPLADRRARASERKRYLDAAIRGYAQEIASEMEKLFEQYVDIAFHTGKCDILINSKTKANRPLWDLLDSPYEMEEYSVSFTYGKNGYGPRGGVSAFIGEGFVKEEPGKDRLVVTFGDVLVSREEFISLVADVLVEDLSQAGYSCSEIEMTESECDCCPANEECSSKLSFAVTWGV